MRNTQPLIEEDELAAAASHAERAHPSSGHVRATVPVPPLTPLTPQQSLTPMPANVMATPASFPPEHVPQYTSGIAPRGSSSESTTSLTTAPGASRRPPAAPAPASSLFSFADRAALEWFLAGLVGGLVVFSLAAVVAWAFSSHH